MSHSDAAGESPGAVLENRKNEDCLVALVLFGFHLLLYWMTLTPGLGFKIDPFNPPGDSHEFTQAIFELRLARRTGYPIYTWLGHLFVAAMPFGEVAYRTNLLSAVFGATAVAMLFGVARRLWLGRACAAFAAIVFGITPTFWSQAVITEVYTLNVLALSTVLWLLIGWARRPSTLAFAGFALAYGISIGCHTSNLSLAAAIAPFVLYTDPGILKRGRTLASGVFAFLVGVSQYVWLPLMADTAQFPNPTPDSWGGFYRYTLGAFSNLRFAYPLEKLPGRFLLYLSHLDQNFTLIGIALGSLGLVTFLARRTAYFGLLFGIFAINVVIAMQVFATDLEVFFLPSYIVWAIFLGAGTEALWNGIGVAAARWQSTARAVVGNGIRVLLVLFLGFWALSVGSASYSRNDRSADTAFEDFYETVFSILPKDAYLVAFGPGVFSQGAVHFQTARGMRPDVTIHTKRAPLKMPRQAVYSAMPVVNGRAKRPFSGTAVPKNAWFTPVLVGNHKDLVLYRVDRNPPQLFLRGSGVVHSVGGPRAAVALERVGLRVVDEPPRPRLHLDLQWSLPDLKRRTVLYKVDDALVASHQLGLGNLNRYAAEVGAVDGDLVGESYDLVLPRSLPPGDHVLEVGVVTHDLSGFAPVWFEPRRFSTATLR